jgi:hypothetical protein
MAHSTPPASDPDHHPDRPRAAGSDPVRPRRPATNQLLGYWRGPFAWQHGNRLLLLEARPLSWILAELHFDPATCRYLELRRIRYRWAREATGALLSRVLATGETTAEQTARDLDAWLIRQGTGDRDREPGGTPRG